MYDYPWQLSEPIVTFFFDYKKFFVFFTTYKKWIILRSDKYLKTVFEYIYLVVVPSDICKVTKETLDVKKLLKHNNVLGVKHESFEPLKQSPD